MINRWFTHYLYGLDNGVEAEPPVWIVRENDQHDQPTPYADFPNPQSQALRFHLLPTGSQLGGLLFGPPKSATRESLIDDASIPGKELAQADESQHRLLYATPRLKAPVHISGHPRIHLRVAVDMPAANLSVWILSLPWTHSKSSSANIVTRGWVDPQNYASESEGRALERGEFYTLEFELEPDDQIIPPGQRLALMLFSSDHDFTLWPPPGTQLTFDLSECWLELPIVGGEKAWLRARPR